MISITSSPKVIWEEPRSHPSWQRMDSPAACATIRAMPTHDNHSAAGTHCIHTAQTDTRRRYILRPAD